MSSNYYIPVLDVWILIGCVLVLIVSQYVQYLKTSRLAKELTEVKEEFVGILIHAIQHPELFDKLKDEIDGMVE